MGDAIDLNCAVDPRVAIFAKKAVAPHHIPLEKAVLEHSTAHVLGGAGTEVAPGPVGVGDDVLVEPNDFFSPFGKKGGFCLLFLSRQQLQGGILAPRLFKARLGDGRLGDEEEENKKPFHQIDGKETEPFRAGI